MANFDRGLEDLAFITKRFAGLIEMGERIKEAQVLVNQTEELKKTVASLSAEVEATKADNTKAKKALSDTQAKVAQADKDAENARKRRDEAAYNYDQDMIRMKRDRDAVQKDIDDFKTDLLKQVQAEAEARQKELAKETVDAEQRLAKALEAIAKLKGQLGQ
jgi:regulator of replication initiation timing